MSGDEDIARLLPELPPSRPARRAATIALALERFDGDAASAPVSSPKPVGARAFRGLVWGPAGAFASILLVALIGVPIALRNPGGDLARPGPRSGSPVAERGAVPGTNEARTPAERPEARPPQVGGARAPVPAAGKPEGAAAPVELAGSVREAAAAPPPPPPPPPVSAPAAPPAMAAPAVVAQDVGEMVVTGRRIEPQASRSSVTAVTVVSKETLSEDSDIVVSGTRRAPGGSGRGDWNACTIADPERNLHKCERLIDVRDKGTKGAAAVQLSEGLRRGWRQDWAGAIVAFDQAIALQPKLAFAWLNRGLAHQQAGDLVAAEADLDRAVRYAPRAARNHYHRSLVRRARGDARGARADAVRALRLDPDYDAVIED